MTSIALPRIKVKKRKRRPPSKREKEAMFWALWCVFWCLWDVWIFAKNLHLGGVISAMCGPLMLGFAIFNLLLFRRVWWPVVLNYIRNGFEDD